MHFQYEMLCAIWYHFYNLKNVKNAHGGELLLVKLPAEALNYKNCTISRKASQTYIIKKNKKNIKKLVIMKKVKIRRTGVLNHLLTH